jgi:hypothetical protein
LAKARARKLKVFHAQIGFYDTVVAAPSQAAALRAWGTHQNLFADGLARLTDEPQAVEAALANPDTPLKRGLGSSDPYSVEGTLPQIPDVPRSSATRSAPKAHRPPTKPPPDRSALNSAEEALKKLEDDRKLEEAGFIRRLEALRAEQLNAQEAYVEARKAANETLAKVRRTYRGAGGRD